MATLHLTSTEGTKIPVSAPVSLPSQERAEELRALYQQHVKHLDRCTSKGSCYARVPKELADDVAEAMNFMGSLVDVECPYGKGSVMDNVYLYSRGYWAHGF